MDRIAMRQPRMGHRRSRIGAIGLVACALAMGLATPARALLIDDFSTGGFALMAGAGGGTTAQACGAFCVTGTREVFLLSGNPVVDASVQPLFATGEAANVMPDGGGLLRFTYVATAGTSLDLSVGGPSGVLEVWFDAFVVGASVRVWLEDTSGVSESVALTPAGLVTPTSVDFLLSDFVAVDLGQIVRVSVEAPDFGDYHV